MPVLSKTVFSGLWGYIAFSVVQVERENVISEFQLSIQRLLFLYSEKTELFYTFLKSMG